MRVRVCFLKMTEGPRPLEHWSTALSSNTEPSPRRKPRQETPGEAQGKKPEGTLVVRRSQARGRMASQPHTNHHARAKADRQTDRQTEQAATPTPIRHLSGRVPHPKIRRGAPVTTRTGPRTREAPLCAAPHTALSSSSSSSTTKNNTTTTAHGDNRVVVSCHGIGE